ncbi:MAG: HAD family hydrolase [Planctomycetota bacterium]
MQHGSDTLIGNHVRLVVFDCYETLIQMQDRRYRARRGVAALLRHLQRGGKLLVVLSDGERAQVEADLEEADLQPFFTQVFGCEEACRAEADGRMMKLLEVPIEACRVQIAQTVFVGDSPLDGQAAERAGVPFIRVPRSEDASFSFARLIGGSSRYSSGVFDDTLRRLYRGGGGDG